MIARLLVMIAVFLMPFGMTPAAAHESMQASMPMGHCSDRGSTHQSKGALEGCTMACSSALPAAEIVREQPMAFDSAPAALVPVHILRGLHPETATPPPRIA